MKRWQVTNKNERRQEDKKTKRQEEGREQDKMTGEKKETRQEVKKSRRQEEERIWRNLMKLKKGRRIHFNEEYEDGWETINIRL